MNPIHKLHNLGQSLWYDNIQRSLLTRGIMEKMIQDGQIRGVTSNPSIFQKAISASKDYDLTLRPMAWSGLDAESIFWRLAIEDIRAAADLFLPLYKETKKIDGYVSLEVNPHYAHNTEMTISEARKLWKEVDRPNLMIKIPATREGLPAVRQAISEGININVTLIFAIERYLQVMDAYLSGLEDRLTAGKDIQSIASVASFFVSRVDTKVDGYLESLLNQGTIKEEVFKKLAGRAAIVNAKLAYREFEKVLSSRRFLELQKNGAQVQRPLWASTSTKNSNYRDVIYIEELIGNMTVNTVPPATLDAFLDHGIAEITIHRQIDQCEKFVNDLTDLGIDLSKVTDELEIEGVKAFSDAFEGLIFSVENRREKAVKEIKPIASDVAIKVQEFEKTGFAKRLHAKDPSLWTDDPSGQNEIRQRMNWLTAPWDSLSLTKEIGNLGILARDKGFTHCVLLGMGGSSLAPEVIYEVGIANNPSGLKLLILDSTDPDQVLEASRFSPIEKTLYVVASKSGTTGEINAFLDYFWELAVAKVKEKAGDHFLAITDPNTKLETLARERNFWKVINADPEVGGRNSALTAFGLVPASLVGLNINSLLENAAEFAGLCDREKLVFSNPGLVLGAIIGTAVLKGRDKLTILTDPDWKSFGYWMEQLLAESSGKNGKGIIPIANEPLAEVEKYSNDRLFIYMRSSGKLNEHVDNLMAAGNPVITMDVSGYQDLGGQFYQWEVATAVACSIMGVNSFDQPDVQDAKTRTIKSIEDFRKTGRLTDLKPTFETPHSSFFTDSVIEWESSESTSDVILQFLSTVTRDNDYIAINAFVPRNEANEKELQKLRTALQTKFQLATTVGFGPRYLHSTGQLHKGGPDNCVILLITAQREQDLEIPGKGLTFGTMQRAQAIGDLAALKSKNRRALWIDLKSLDIKLINQ